MLVRRKNTFRTKHLSNNSMPSKIYLEDEEGAKLLVLRDWLKNDVDALFVQITKLERTVECIENYIEEKTGVESSKELTDSSDSEEETIIFPKATISKKKHKYPGKRKKRLNNSLI